MLGIRKGTDRGFVPFMLAATAIFLITWIVRAERRFGGLFGPHEYWASQWATDYREGFVNRGLLGETLRSLGIDNTNYLFLTFASWLVAIALFVLVVNALWRATRDLGAGVRYCLMAALVMSPAISGILVETVGDPLQLLLLLNIALASFLLSGKTPPLVVALVYGAFGAAMVLVHEASIFFFLPWIAVQAFLIQKTAASRAAFAGNCLAGLVVVAIIVVRGFSAGGLESPTLHLGDENLVYQGRLAPPFAVLLGEELQRMFGSGLAGYLETILRVAGASLIPVVMAGVLMIARLGGSAGSASHWPVLGLGFLIPLVGLGPLMLIAHDWGRFLSYELMLYVLTLSFMKLPATSLSIQPRTLIALAGAMALSGITTTMALKDYRIDGLYADTRTFAACFLLIGVFGLLAFLYRREATPAQSI
jgi:hypothetical protein